MAKFQHDWSSTQLSRPPFGQGLPIIPHWSYCRKCGCHSYAIDFDGRPFTHIFFDRHGKEVSRCKGSSYRVPLCLDGEVVVGERPPKAPSPGRPRPGPQHVPAVSKKAADLIEEIEKLPVPDQRHIYLFLHSSIRAYVP